MERMIAWMADNGVAANLLMAFLLFVGVVSALTVTQKVFPEFSLDTIQVRVVYPGASPEEIEDAIVRRIEEQVEAIEGIRQINATAAENVGIVTIELQRGADVTQKLDEVKAEIDRITTFPEEAEEPEVRELTNRQRVLEIALYGDASERALKELAYRVDDELSAKEVISFVQVSGVRPYEVSIEVPTNTLRAYGLTLPEIASIVRQNSLDLPGGDIETASEEILVRVEGQNYDRRDFEEIIVVANDDGASVRLGQIARIEDAFEDTDLVTRFNDEPAAIVEVFRTADEQVLAIEDAVRTYLDEELRPTLPSGVEAEIWRNDATQLRGRLSLLVKNGLMGLALVILTLALFLNLRLAFWVSAGIFISFIGAFAVMRLLGVSINQLSLFGFILAIGIVVDDAIVVGENIFAERERGASGLEAARRGVKRVAVPVVFAVATTIAAFTPLLFVPGTIGKITNDIPTIVIAVLVLSLVESLLILPHHLSTLKSDEERGEPNRVVRAWQRVQEAMNRRLQAFINGPLDRALRFATRHYGVVVCGALTLILLVGGLVAGGYIRFSFLPDIEGEFVTANLELSVGTPAEETRAVANRLAARARSAAEALQGELAEDAPALLRNVYVSVGRGPQEGGPGGSGGNFVQSNRATVVVELLDPEERDLASSRFESAWRDSVGAVASARTLTFSSELIELGAPVQVELSAPDPDDLDRAVARLERELQTIGGVFDVRNDQDVGKSELEVRLLDRARVFGVTLESLASQVRAAFFGAEALRVQRGREEVRVYVRLPDAERDALADLDNYRIRNDRGGAVPLSEVADVGLGTGPSAIRRLDGRRIVTVTADVNPGVTTGQEVTTRLRSEVLPSIERDVPGLRYTFGGEQREQQRALGALARNFAIALFVIYALLAIPFRSYIQPLVIMAAIPFGLIGAALGHLIMGLSIGILSIFGIVGLSGVVVNDSLVMIDFINEERLRGKPMHEAVIAGAKSRFRPILLTSLTTFLGVFPLIIEQSVQAQFLIPLAVSIGFGILFGTVIIVVLVPALVMLEYRWAVRLQRRVLNRSDDEIRVVHTSRQRG